MKKTKRKSTHKKKGLAVTASLVIFASNLSLSVPSQVTFAEGNSTGTVIQENENEVQVISPPTPTEEMPQTTVDQQNMEEQTIEEQQEITSEPLEEDPESVETQQSAVPEPQEDIIEKQEVDYQSLPSLLITEIMPNNAGADDYEYFEVYNNTNQPVLLDHFTFSLRYTDGSGTADVDMTFAPVTLEPKETMVFWHNSNHKTVEDFNSHYQTNVPTDKMVQIDGAPNFYNGGNRAVVIKDTNGNDLVLANYLLDDIASGLVVQYQYPANGIEMTKLATKTQPTPGTLVPEQVPAQEVITAGHQAPVITHTPVTEANNSDDLVISAQITDDHDDLSASVYYQTEPGTDFIKIKMAQVANQTYEAIIPRNSLTTNKLSYYIEASDQNNRVAFSKENPMEVAIKTPEKIDYNAIPPLLITEISPNSAGGGTDYYEYFELHNNSDQPQVLTNYSFIYYYTDTGKELPFQIPATTIEPGETLVFWFNNGQKMLAEFNQHFQTALTANQVIEFTDTFPGFANGGNRALVLKNQQGAEVISASYLGSDNDNTGAGIQYKFPFSGTVMEKLQGLAAPMPGSTSSDQVPEVPVHIPEPAKDTVAPVIDHTPVQESEAFLPIKIEAKVTDNLSVPLVTLYYKEQTAEHFTVLSMNPSPEDANLFTAEIPAASVSDDVTYYIEATDGANVETSTENTILVKEQNIDYNKVPYLLVTELVPDSSNVGTADGYEFIEIYNNSNKEINFKDYKLYYRYGTDPGTDVVWPSVPEEVTIPAGETLTFWIINDQNTEKTVADFNAHYGENLVENQNIVRIYTGGMANSSMRGLVIGTNTHKEIALAYYNDAPNVDDTIANKGIMYSYPLDQSTQQNKLMIDNASPGKVEANQVPKQRVQLPEDTLAPIIDNRTAITETSEKENIRIVADVKDDQEVKSVRLFYKISGQSDYQMQILQKDTHDSLYHSIIPSPEIIGKEEVDYYFVASDGTNEQTSEHKQIKVTNDHDQSSLRLNVNEGQILNGQVILKGTSATDAPADVTLSVDGTEFESETYQSLERTAYFAFDVNGLNTYFQNAVTMGDEILYLMDGDWLTQWKTFSIPIVPDRLQLGDNVLTVRSGNKATPFDLGSLENRDDYDLKNVRLVLSDGTVLTDPSNSNPTQVLKMNDANPFVDFYFTIKEEHALSKTVNWDTTLIPDGEHSVLVKDTDEEKAVKILVDNTAPVIESNLTEGKEYKGAFIIEANVTDAIAGVKTVETFLDDKKITLPYETASSKLSPGNHKVTIKGTDHAGNTTELIVHFSVVNENPEQPEGVSPANGEHVSGDPTLKVKVTDPTGDEVDVTFYQGYQYDAGMPSVVKGFKHASDTEPPQSMAPVGEQAFTSEDQSLVSAVDGNYLTTDSDTQFPYHRFDVTVDDSVGAEDKVELYWKGKSLEGRKVSMYAWNHQEGDWALIDYQIAGVNDFELSGNVDVSEFMKDQKVNVLIQDEIPSTPDEYDYTFVWMSDTQYYAESFPYIFDRQTQWIAEKQDEMKIEYVFHTGDLVNVSTDVSQWNYADQYMGVLDEHQIPYGVLAGNHDVNQVNNDYTDYYKYFGADRFEDKPYYGDSYLNNRGHYDLISAGGNDYIMVYLGWGVTDEGIAWVNDVLAAHPDRKAILSFHEYLLATGTRHPLGEKLYNEIVVPNENVIAVLSGHYHEAQTYINELDDNGDGTPDRKVYQMLADYQAGPEGGQGYMRLLHFDQDNNRVVVNTYSPYLDDYNYYDTDAYPGKDEFVIELDLAAVNKQVATDYFAVNVFSDAEIGKDQGVASGETAQTMWKGLTEGETYSWYAVAEDAFTGRTTSDIWTFVKGENGQAPDPNDGGQEGPPTEPEQPGRPVDPIGPGPVNSGGDSNGAPGADSKQPSGKTNAVTKNGNTLPNTATNQFNYLLTGTALLIAGALSFLFGRNRKQQ
ncbi:lamin tail domain-containing protein [Bacillus sp. MRMR6]|uniref:lamin tail domain-containing protein n=1 Tax=Bacillus sp. MRMR6 TaxID=1928617 RepID=UPI000951617C|nr:lamin tail domain-containing protein [Bacillus sp. MRMR6]OLS35885.1 metallophosphoesterase [Bacillus sp. MRMR6]